LTIVWAEKKREKGVSVDSVLFQPNNPADSPSNPSFFGRPRGRRVDSIPSSFAVRTIQGASPNGRPRWMLSRRRFTSNSVAAR
jgi:hypothetical protein